jgi:hypothetical protein
MGLFLGLFSEKAFCLKYCDDNPEENKDCFAIYKKQRQIALRV